MENTKPGTTAWQLDSPASMANSINFNPADYAVAEIQGYASLTSVNQGGSIDFHVRTINTNPYSLSIFRIGWYNGAGGRLMLGPVTLPGVVQPMPSAPVYPPSGTGIVECNWSVSYSLTVPTDWVSGVYLVKLSLSSPFKESYIVFVVRDDARNSPVLFQSSVATYQAYNDWGGSSLYTTDSHGNKTGVKVSFDRPYWENYGAGNFLGLNEPGPEIQMVRWLERQGYDVTYATDIDTHEHPNTVLSHKVFLVVGHDEYWSRNMRDNVTQGRDAGVHLGIFGADVLYWQVRFEPSSTGVADRTMVGYKELASMDPVSDPRLRTTSWRDLGEPEGALLGVQFNGFSAPTVSDIVVTNASHWLFNGTGVTNGTVFPNVEGYETDSVYQPSGATVLAHSPFPRDNPQVFGDMTIYTAASGALVFATGSIEWCLGLDDLSPSPGVVPAMQQVTANFLSRALFPDTNAWYTVVSRNSGQCLDVPTWSGTNWGMNAGTQLQQWTCWGGPMQKWQFTRVSGGYEVTNQNSGMQLDVAGGPVASAYADGNPVIQWPYWGGTNEIWQLVQNPDGYYELQPVNSGGNECLDVTSTPETNYAQNPASPVQQYACWGGPMQEWSLVPAQ